MSHLPSAGPTVLGLVGHRGPQNACINGMYAWPCLLKIPHEHLTERGGRGEASPLISLV